ncbi:MAG: hypothetical protein J6C37_05015 [Roseburia sp.]|nr:hypothetical protein [Roseburia sp.]
MITLYSQNIWNKNPAGYRNALVRSLVSDFDSDVCAFQECGPMSNRVGSHPIVEIMSDVYVEATPEFADVNYTPVFYKKDKFNLIDSGYLVYDGLNDANSKSVTWIVLEDKESKKRYAFASTHFWWKFRGDEDTKQRLQNAAQLKEVCDNIVERYNIPVVIGGDFNNGKNAPQCDVPYQRMLKWGFRDIRDIAEVAAEEEFTCRDGYPILKDDETFDKCPIAPEYCIDYIFIYGNYPVKVKKFYIETNDKALTSSDHCPLVGKFEF